MAYMVKEFKVHNCAGVRDYQILVWNNYGSDGKSIKATTRQIRIEFVRDLMYTLMDMETYALRPDRNPAEHIVLRGVEDQVESRHVIPEDILKCLDSHVDELDEDWRLIYGILRETGWRFNEAAGVCVDDIEDTGDDDYCVIYSKIEKTKEQRRKHHLPDRQMDVIKRNLYERIQDYIKTTARAREAYGTDLIFFSGHGGQAHPWKTQNFNDAINALLRKHDMKSIDETYVVFTSGQTRPTVATALIDAGEPVVLVQNKLGHIHRSTTEKYYIRARVRKLAELNNKFFEECFSKMLDPELAELLTPQERDALYQYFLFSYEGVGYGSCNKLACPDCSKQGVGRCAECTKMVTTPENLPAWEKAQTESDMRLQQIRGMYAKIGIDAEKYSEFEEVRNEVRKNTALKNVVSAIKSWAEERK